MIHWRKTSSSCKHHSVKERNSCCVRRMKLCSVQGVVLSCLFSMHVITTVHRDCEQRLKSCDDAFREQLEAKEKVYDTNLRRLAAEKDREIDLANQKVRLISSAIWELIACMGT